MKKVVLIIFLIAINNYAQEDIDKLKGQIISVKKIYLIPYKKGKEWIDGKIQAEFDTFFDKNGNIIKEIEKNDKNIVLEKNYIYKNEEETKNFCTELLKNTEGKEENSIINFCKKEKNIYMKIQYNYSPTEKKQKPFRTFFYKKDKNILEEYTFDTENILEYKTTLKYDKSGNIKEKIKQDIDSKQLEREIYIYSSPPLIITHKFFDSNDILKKEIIEEYRSDNTLRKKTEIIYDELEQLFSKTEIEFDKNELKTKEIIYSQDNTPQNEYFYEYVLDKRGNWIKEIKNKKILIYNKKVESSEPPQIIKREIEYYK